MDYLDARSLFWPHLSNCKIGKDSRIELPMGFSPYPLEENPSNDLPTSGFELSYWYAHPSIIPPIPFSVTFCCQLRKITV